LLGLVRRIGLALPAETGGGEDGGVAGRRAAGGGADEGEKREDRGKTRGVLDR